MSLKRYFVCAGIQKRHSPTAELYAGAVFRCGNAIAWTQDVPPGELRLQLAVLQQVGIAVHGDFSSVPKTQSHARTSIGA
jgi:hypothetical protein